MPLRSKKASFPIGNSMRKQMSLLRVGTLSVLAFNERLFGSVYTP